MNKLDFIKKRRRKKKEGSLWEILIRKWKDKPQTGGTHL